MAAMRRAPLSLQMGSSLMAFRPEGDTRARRSIPEPKPTPADELDPRTCIRCGFPGPHFDAYDCIDALRDLVAKLQHALNRSRLKREA
jgi:hypothetical protein